MTVPLRMRAVLVATTLLLPVLTSTPALGGCTVVPTTQTPTPHTKCGPAMPACWGSTCIPSMVYVIPQGGDPTIYFTWPSGSAPCISLEEDEEGDCDGAQVNRGTKREATNPWALCGSGEPEDECAPTGVFRATISVFSTYDCQKDSRLTPVDSPANVYTCGCVPAQQMMGLELPGSGEISW